MNGRYLGETHYDAQNQPQKYIRYTYDEVGSITGIGVRNDLNSEWTEYYFETNLQGDVIAVYTAANNSQTGLPELVASYTYDAWGNILSATGELAQLNPFRYRGYYYDTETQFYYLQSRYYDPQIGRFLNADDITFLGVDGSVDSYNQFAYCGNNPIVRTDFTGQWFGWDDLIAAGVGAFVEVASLFVSDVAVSVKSGSLQFSSWETYAGAAFGGAAGGITTLYAGPVTGAAVSSGMSTLLCQTFENVTGKQNRSVFEIMKNATVEAAKGAALEIIVPVDVPGVTSGRNSMQSVYKSGLTKLANKTAKRMSAKVICKGIVSGFVDNLNSTFFDIVDKLATE